MKKSEQILKKAKKILSRLPLELQQEIFRYLLISTQSIDVADKGSILNRYEPKEASRAANEELRRTANLLLGLPEERYGKLPHLAYAWFLGNNKFSIGSKNSANALVEATQTVSDKLSGNNKEIYPRSVYGLYVNVPHDPFVGISTHSQDVGDPHDFEAGDPVHAGLRALRILKPLTKLDHLRFLSITLRDYRLEEYIFQGIGESNNSGILLVAAVIARLKELMDASLHSSQFRVSCVLVHGHGGYGGFDSMNWLWEPLSEADRSRVEHYMEYKLEKRNILSRMEDSRARKEEKKKLEAQLGALKSQFGRIGKDGILLERWRVSDIAANPKWEDEAEMFVKRQGRYKDYRFLQDEQDSPQDNDIGLEMTSDEERELMELEAKE